MKENKEEFYLLGLDVSTKTIGISLFNNQGQLLELTHISPIIKPASEFKIEELIKKANLFKDFISKYATLNIKHVVIEEPLLKSNNANTAGILMKFNGMISKEIYDIFNIVPKYVTTYEARKNAFPELMQPNANNKIVLFGGYPSDVDKKKVLWDLVAKREPQIKWLLDKKGKLKKENFDMSDSYVVILAYMNINKMI